MIVERAMSNVYLSNTYLVADKQGGKAVLIDTGGPLKPIVDKIEELGVKLTHILLTHHHIDHVAHNSDFKFRYRPQICGHGSERELFGDLDRELADGEELVTGELRIRALHTPGHTRGMLAYLINDECVFTGDTLFRNTVGGTRASGHTNFEDIRHSIMDVLMRLPGETRVLPGHTEATSVAAEWENNPFIRIWRGLDETAAQPCSALGRAAILLLRARDYDGGTKCLVRFNANDQIEIVPGSQVKEI